MNMFKSEEDLLKTIERHDSLVEKCKSGEIGFLEFCEKYNNFYSYYALDGHESDEGEQSLFQKHEKRIEPHRVIAYEILGQVCSDEDAEREIYIQAGRFGSAEAIRRLKSVKFMA